MDAVGPELRRDELSGRWVIFAPERLNRPSDFHRLSGAARVSSSRTCPFCEGHEGMTPPEIFALRRPESEPNGPGWRVRVVPNKYPAVGPGRPIHKPKTGLFEARSGGGTHEVIIDAPEHGREWPGLSLERVGEILRVHRDRVALAEKRAGVRFVQLFKNKGREAGASLSHSHTQIIALPVVPVDVLGESLRVEREFRRTGRCPACRVIEAERAAGERWIAGNADFAAIAPFASRFPYETRVFPFRHFSSFAETTEDEIRSLASLSRSILVRLKKAMDDPPYNLILRWWPHGPGAVSAKAGHWSLEIRPVLTHIAGFELGTGMYINPVFPEDAAKALRQ